MNLFQKYLAEEFAEDYQEGHLSRRDALKLIFSVTAACYSPIRSWLPAPRPLKRRWLRLPPPPLHPPALPNHQPQRQAQRQRRPQTPPPPSRLIRLLRRLLQALQPLRQAISSSPATGRLCSPPFPGLPVLAFSGHPGLSREPRPDGAHQGRDPPAGAGWLRCPGCRSAIQARRQQLHGLGSGARHIGQYRS